MGASGGPGWTFAAASVLFQAMDLDARYPAVSDLKRRAKARLPHFVWEYLDSATGAESSTARNRAALDRVLLRSAVLKGEIAAETGTRFLGRDYPAPFGIAPVGMSGLVWPDAERILAGHARRAGIPYTLSTVAAATPEDVADRIGEQGWFQLYTPRDPEVRAEILRRARAAGFHTLVMTVDLPAASRRERQVRGGLTQPPRLTPRLILQAAIRPAWSLRVLAHGMPRMRLMDSLAPAELTGRGPLPSTAHVGYMIRTSPDLDYLKAVRDLWDGPLIVKGVLHEEAVADIAAAGADAIWVSNHAGRQFDGGVAAIDALPGIRAATRLPLVFDSGIEGGLDILRAIALGADFVMLGRAWHYALAALGQDGPAHLQDILVKDMKANMGQIGAHGLADLADRLVAPQGGTRGG